MLAEYRIPYYQNPSPLQRYLVNHFVSLRSKLSTFHSALSSKSDAAR